MIRADIVVIGGGVIGLTVARRLAHDGHQVTVVERVRCGQEASWAGAGVLSPANPHRKDAAAVLLLRSLTMYPRLCAELADETGIDPEYEQCGEIELAFDERGLQSLREDVCAAGGRTVPDALRRTESTGRCEVLHSADDVPLGRADAEVTPSAFAAPGPRADDHAVCRAGAPLAFEMLTTDQARAIEPAVSEQAVGAMLCRETAQVRNPRLLRALHASCVRAGVFFREETAVADFDCSGDRVRGVRLGPGGDEVLHADAFVLCAGAWSSQIGARLDSLMPVRPVRGQMMLLRFESRPFTHIIARGKTYLVPRRDGHVLLGATEERDAGFNKRCTAKGLSTLMTKGLRLAPGIAEAEVAATWAGLRPGTSDDLPYLGWVPGMEGLIAATGHFRTGLSMAPGTAEYVAALLAGRAFDLDLSCCAVGRNTG